MEKRYIYIIIGLLVLVAGVFVVNAAVDKTGAWHDSSDILVTVDGYTMTLQKAVDEDVFIDGATQSYTSEILAGHNSADEIFVSVDGVDMSLQYAISTSLCGISSPSSSYTSGINLGHSADNILVSVGGSEMSLQVAINSGELVSVDGVWGGSWVNVGSCGTYVACKQRQQQQTCVGAICGGTCSGAYPEQDIDCGLVDGGWSDWSCGTCPAACGGTYYYCERTCTNPAPTCDGADCGLNSQKTVPCNDYSTCTYSWEVGDWGDCSAGCVGIQTRDVWCERSDGTIMTWGVWVEGPCGEEEYASSQECSSDDATSSYRCYAGDVWWYDSYGTRCAMKEDCGELGCSGYSCKPDR